jgi:signal peptidase I
MSEFISRSERQRRERLERKQQERKSSGAFDWLKVIIIALILAVVLRGFMLEPTYVQGPSMLTTMKTGDRIIINKLIYRFTTPARGEIIVFHTPEEDLIKRVIALPGETIEAKNGRVYVNGKILSEPYLSPTTQTSNIPQTKVPAGHLFVMGDNRANSMDSRELGPIALDQIVGRAELIYWPIAEWKQL